MPADANPIPVAELAQGSLVDIWFTLDGLDFWDVPTETPDGYYSDVDTSSTDGLRATLHQLIDDHEVLPYSHRSWPGQGGHRIDTWDVIAADAHPDDPSAVIDLYLNGRFVRRWLEPRPTPDTTVSTRGRNRWGFRTTARATRPIPTAITSSRHTGVTAGVDNKPYAASDDDPAYGKPTIEGVGRGGSLSDEPDTHNYSPRVPGRLGSAAEEMSPERCFMDLRYGGHEQT